MCFDNMKLVKNSGVEQQIQDKKNPIYPSDPNDVKRPQNFEIKRSYSC